jgi:hypothetical protein
MKNGIIITKINLLIAIITVACSILVCRDKIDEYHSFVLTTENRIASTPIIRDIGKIVASFGDTETFLSSLDGQIL